MTPHDRWDMAEQAIRAAGFHATADDIRAGRFYPRSATRMLRWAVHHYGTLLGHEERGRQAKALKCCKALARSVRPCGHKQPSALGGGVKCALRRYHDGDHERPLDRPGLFVWWGATGSGGVGQREVRP